MDTILPRVAAGDPAATQLCIERYAPLVWSLARRFRLVQQDAEDVVQEIFIDLWRNAERYDPDRASEATFVGMIARRRLIDRRRRLDREEAVVQPGDVDNGLEATVSPPDHAGADVATALAAVNTLGPERRRVLLLSLWEGLSHREIAQATGLPLGTVKTHIRRGLDKVRSTLGEGGTS